MKERSEPRNVDTSAHLKPSWVTYASEPKYGCFRKLIRKTLCVAAVHQSCGDLSALCGYDASVKQLGRRLAIVLACAAAYEWFVVEAIPSEAIAAVAVGIAVLLVHERLVRVAPPNARVSLAFAGPFVRRVLPGIVRESFDLLGPTLWRALVRREPTTGRWIALRYQAGDLDSADERGRRTVTIVGSNLTPNALPLDIDETSGRIVLHQLVARREAAAADPRYPM